MPLPRCSAIQVMAGVVGFIKPTKAWLARPSALKGLKILAQGKFRPQADAALG